MNLTKQHIKIDIIESNELKTIIDSELPWTIRAEDSTWSLVPGEYIHVINFSVFSMLKIFINILPLDFNRKIHGTLVGKFFNR